MSIDADKTKVLKLFSQTNSRVRMGDYNPKWTISPTYVALLLSMVAEM